MSWKKAEVLVYVRNQHPPPELLRDAGAEGTSSLATVSSAAFPAPAAPPPASPPPPTLDLLHDFEGLAVREGITSGELHGHTLGFQEGRQLGERQGRELGEELGRIKGAIARGSTSD